MIKYNKKYIKRRMIMKRTIAVLLALLMLLSSATLLFSCKGDKDEGKDKGGSDVGEALEDDGSIFYERSLVDDGVETVDYGGRVLRLAADTSQRVVIAPDEVNKGDLFKDAHAARTQKVEARFNAKLEVIYEANYVEMNSWLNKTILSGADEFDLLVGMVMGTGGVVKNNLFLNWYDIEHVDFSKPWWFETNSTELTYNGKNVIAVSHLNFNAVSGVYCLYYNKNLAAAWDLPNLYDLVFDGKWTFDKLAEIVKDIYTDNGDDVRGTDDFYGYSIDGGTSMNAYLWAFDNSPAKKNPEGVPEIMQKNDKTAAIVEKFYDFCWNNNGVYYDANDTSGGGSKYSSPMFWGRKSIFTTGSLGTATGENARNFEDDYGIVPLPKWDETQAKYMSMVGGHHNCLAVPKTCRDTEFVGRLVEVLSAETWKTVTPTLYEVALKTRYLRDNESKEVMDFIIEGAQFDFGSVYDNWQGFAFMLERLMRTGNKNFTSYYTTQSAKAKYELKQTLKALDKLG
jgi:hypothetical protein